MFYWDPGGSCKFYEVKYSPSATGPSQYIHQHTTALSNSMELLAPYLTPHGDPYQSNLVHLLHHSAASVYDGIILLATSSSKPKFC